MVFYRKYRPQKIDDLDSTRVRETLFSILATDPPHALLFTGPKGLGKTSTARIIAKAVNCEEKSKRKSPNTKTSVKSQKSAEKKPDEIEPCNVCLQCTSITNGTNMDVIEIDAASNRGIDEIRDLKEKIWLSPLSAHKKVYIIDEVHMLTTEAFNALLKTLEEPPSHAIFILCTTEPQKVPATILSRCFHIKFNPAGDEEIARSLKRIASGENIQIDESALLAIAGSAEGGFRDAVKILEELTLSSKGEKITKELFEKLYRTASVPLKLNQLLAALKSRDPKSALQVVAGLAPEGVDLKYFILELLKNLHDQLLQTIGINQNAKGQALFEINEIKELSELFSKAYLDMKYAVLPQLPVELAIIDFTARAGGHPPGQEVPAIDIKKDDSKSEVTIDKLRKQSGAISKIKALYGDTAKNASPDDKNKKIEIRADVELLKVPANGQMTDEWLAAFWKSIISEMKPYNHTVAGVLRSCILKSYDRKLLVIETAFNFHKERLDDLKARAALGIVCKNLTGNEVQIEVQLKKA